MTSKLGKLLPCPRMSHTHLRFPRNVIPTTLLPPGWRWRELAVSATQNGFRLLPSCPEEGPLTPPLSFGEYLGVGCPWALPQVPQHLSEALVSASWQESSKDTLIRGLVSKARGPKVPPLPSR